MTDIPDAFARRMAELYGPAGVTWTRDLPALLAVVAAQWALTLGPPFALSYNYVAPALRAGGSEAVLKVSFPSRHNALGMEAVRLCAGPGVVAVLEIDAARGALLLERLRPGTPLSTLADDEAATAIAAGVMQQLWRPPPPDHGFPTVEDWAAGLRKLRAHFGGATGPLPVKLVEEAESLYAELLPTQAASVLLHGDLHHNNLLAATRQPWLAIDPQGVVGEPAYEVGALLRNPLPQLLQFPDPARVTARRIDLLAEMLGMDRVRIRAWAVAQAVLSVWWTIEDHGHGWEPGLAVAELLARVPD